MGRTGTGARGEATAGARRLAPQARRAQLMPCAVAAVAAMGLERATHAEVARLAGVSVPTVFVYFPKREDLVGAVLDEVEGFLDDIVGSSFAQPVPVERLTALARAFEHAADAQRDTIRVWLDWSTAVRADVWPSYLKVQERIVTNVATALRDHHGGKARKPTLEELSAARMFVGSGHTVALMKLAGARQPEVDELIETIVAATLASR